MIGLTNIPKLVKAYGGVDPVVYRPDYRECDFAGVTIGYRVLSGGRCLSIIKLYGSVTVRTGRALSAKVESLARENGCHSIEVVIGTGDKHAASLQRFIKSLRYRETERIYSKAVIYGDGC